jgi:hypothetical protein
MRQRQIKTKTSALIRSVLNHKQALIMGVLTLAMVTGLAVRMDSKQTTLINKSNTQTQVTFQCCNNEDCRADFGNCSCITLLHTIHGDISPQFSTNQSSSVVSSGLKSALQNSSCDKTLAAQENTSQTALIKNYAQLPLRFEQNLGQIARPVSYLSQGEGYQLFLTHKETVIILQNDKQKQATVIRTSLVNANAPIAFQGQNQLQGKTNYLIGRNKTDWISNVPNYAEVIAKEVYPGIDLRYHGDQQQLEYDFIVAPGAQPNSIKLHFEGGAIKSEVNLSSSYCCLIIPVVIPKIVCPVEL